MNIESTKTTAVSKSTETHSNSTTTPTKEESTSFKEELNAVKSQDKKQPENENVQTQPKNGDAEATQAAQQNTQTNSAQLKEEQIKHEAENLAENLNPSKFSNPMDELALRISALNEIKNPLNNKTQGANEKVKDLELSNAQCFTTMKMNNNDVTFFLNLVQNQQMTAQSTQLQNQNIINNNFTEIKTEKTQAAVQVSQTLLDALNVSAKTGKPFRIDFDKDIAVIMKVDKNGKLSANFIPGDAAVENYLRNNIESLKQSFNEQGLNYGELSYSKHQKQEQEKNKSQNKENEDE